MLTITSTDNQIYISKNGDPASGYPKNTLTYRPLQKSLEISLVSRRETLASENWGAGITINGAVVTRENVNDVLEPLFFSGDTGQSTELPIDVSDVEGLTDILDTKADQIALSEHEENSKVHFQNYTGDLDYVKSLGVYRYDNNQILIVYDDAGGYTSQIRLAGTGFEKRVHNAVQWTEWVPFFAASEDAADHIGDTEVHIRKIPEGKTIDDIHGVSFAGVYTESIGLYIYLIHSDTESTSQVRINQQSGTTQRRNFENEVWSEWSDVYDLSEYVRTNDLDDYLVKDCETVILELSQEELSAGLFYLDSTRSGICSGVIPLTESIMLKETNISLDRFRKTSTSLVYMNMTDQPITIEVSTDYIYYTKDNEIKLQPLIPVMIDFKGFGKTRVITWEILSANNPDVINLYIPDNEEDPAGIEVIDKTGMTEKLLNKFRRCMCKMNGQNKVDICYLDDNDSNYYEDGTEADLTGNDGDIMVTIPEFWYRIDRDEENEYTNIKVSTFHVPGFIHSKPSLIGALVSSSRAPEPSDVSIHEMSYLGGNDPGTYDYPDPMRKYRNYIKGEKNNYWTNTTFTQAFTVVLMHMLKYKDRNIHNTIGVGRGLQNYKQPNIGGTVSLGIKDTTPANGGVNNEGTLTNFLGIEGFFGGYGQLLHQDDVLLNDNSVIRLLDPAVSDSPIEIFNPVQNNGQTQRLGITQMQIGIEHDGVMYLGMFPKSVNASEFRSQKNWASNFIFEAASSSTYDVKLCIGGYNGIYNQYNGATEDVMGLSTLYLCRIREDWGNVFLRAIRIAFHGDINIVPNVTEFRGL